MANPADPTYKHGYPELYVKIHEEAGDPHPQYLKASSAGNQYLPLAGGRMTGRLGTTNRNFTVTAGAASLPVNLSNDFAQTDVIDASTTLTLTGGVDGDCGTIHCVQDGTGYAIVVAASGRTIVYMGNEVPTTAGSAVDISYKFVTVNAVAQVRVYSTEEA